MACRGCGKRKAAKKNDPNTKKCCLCGKITGYPKPWGKAYCCKTCRDFQKIKLEDMKKDVARIEDRLAGKE